MARSSRPAGQKTWESREVGRVGMGRMNLWTEGNRKRRKWERGKEKGGCASAICCVFPSSSSSRAEEGEVCPHLSSGRTSQARRWPSVGPAVSLCARACVFACVWQRSGGYVGCFSASCHLQHELPLPSHNTVYVWAAALSSAQQRQNMFFPLRIWKLGRLHRQTAGYYLSQPEDVIISEGKVEQTVGTGGFLPHQVSELESK